MKTSKTYKIKVSFIFKLAFLLIPLLMLIFTIYFINQYNVTSQKKWLNNLYFSVPMTLMLFGLVYSIIFGTTYSLNNKKFSVQIVGITLYKVSLLKIKSISKETDTFRNFKNKRSLMGLSKTGINLHLTDSSLDIICITPLEEDTFIIDLLEYSPGVSLDS